MGSSRRVSAGTGAPAKDQTRLKIERMEAEREARRRAMQDRKQERAEEEQRNIAAGNPGDVDFIGLVRKWRAEHQHLASPMPDPSTGRQPKICICVRKRPVFDRERRKMDHDSVTCFHPTVCVHSAKFKVDGITKYLDHNSFRFDYSFDEKSTTEQVYNQSTMPLLHFITAGNGRRATVFAYGQTGSGKTYTMSGIQSMVAEDLFNLLDENQYEGDEVNVCSFDDTLVTVSFFELYGGRIQDLLNKRQRLKILEDGKGEVVITGLEEFEANDASELMALVDTGNKNRTTHATEANDASSRSHAICQINLRSKSNSRLRGKISLVDLAGSERGTDTKSHNRQRRTESSEINKSLLALKECIRALDGNKSGASHVPYRASKLTLILKDCFTSKLARTAMIATVSPGASSADHTLNTLRYADRIKENKVGDMNVSVLHENTDVEHPKGKSPRSAKQSPRVRSPRQARSPRSHPSRQSPRAVESGRGFNKSAKEDDTDDIDLLHATLHVKEEEGGNDVKELHRTVQNLYDEEENLLNLHMSVIQENAELLTEEGRLLQAVQGDDAGDYDIDRYASRLGTILDRKTHLISLLQEKLSSFRNQLRMEEEISRKVDSLPEY